MPVSLSTPALLNKGEVQHGANFLKSLSAHPGGPSTLTPAPAMLHRQAAFTAVNSRKVGPLAILPA